MEFHLLFEGGKQPGLAICGTREDIANYAEKLLSECRSPDAKNAGNYLAKGEPTMITGAKCDWLSFKLVSAEELHALQAKEGFFPRHQAWLEFLGAVLGLVVVALAIKGVVSLFG